jgi:flagellar hook-associated protein 3 FlgL
MSMDVKGVPANGDSFSVKPSEKQSVFTTITNLIKTLRIPAPTARAARRPVERPEHRQLEHEERAGQCADRAGLGGRAHEGNRQPDSTGDDLDIQYQTTLGTLQDLDMVKAISLFAQQQQTLQAAQMSFKTMSGLSLFNYIS